MANRKSMCVLSQADLDPSATTYQLCELCKLFNCPQPQLPHLKIGVVRAMQKCCEDKMKRRMSMVPKLYVETP